MDGVELPQLVGKRFPMRIEDLDAHWHALTEDVITGMKEWRSA